LVDLTHLEKCGSATLGPPSAGKQLMRAAMKQLNIRPRAFHRILKLARTIAHWAGCEKIETHYSAEAVTSTFWHP
jgi:predicted ATPase with chaperone activity